MNEPTARTMISCEGVWKVYGGSWRAGSDHPEGGTVAVKDVSFSVREGECFIVMGLSGSGKSTLVRCLTRLIPLTRGTVHIADYDLTGMRTRELTQVRRDTMGMVFQSFALLPHLNVLDNIAFPLSIRGVPQKARIERAHELVALVGLSGKEERYPAELSGGQQQRVGIARALSCDPKVLFMDEPFSALDPLLRRELQDAFLRLRARLRKTIVFITHDFDEAIHLGDRIAIMKDGEILEVAAPDDLLLRSKHPYIAEFTKHVDRSRVLRARSIARPLPTGYAPSSTVAAERLLYQVAAEVLTSEAPVGVECEGKLVGVIDRSDVLAQMTS